MELQDIIISGDIEATIENLKQKTVEVPEWPDLEKEYDQEQHPIVSDSSLRPDDKIGENGKKELAAKVTYPAEKIAVRRMTQMAFSIPVNRMYDTLNESGTEDEVKKAQSRAMEAIYKGVRIDGENVNRMKAYFAACEVLTVWYAVEGQTIHTKYGFPTKFKLRCRSYSPMPEKWSRITQADLYPLFDEHDDMIAMSFEYVRTEGDEDVTYFETYTATNHYRWKNAGEWEEEVNEAVIIGKIPCAYMRRPLPIWEGASNNRNEIEFTLSRESDIIRKNSAPIVSLAGELIGEKPAGDKAREVYQMKEGGKLDLISPAISHEAAQFYIDQLKQNIEEDLQLPNLSLENIKGLGAISGEARKTLLTDGHLKVGDEQHEIARFLEREDSVIRALLCKVNTGWAATLENLSIEHEITPFIQNDELAEIEKMEKATGGKAILSRKTAIAKARLVDDPEAEFTRIQEEEQATAENSRMTDLFEAGV